MLSEQAISELIEKVNSRASGLYETEKNYAELQLKYDGMELKNAELKAKVAELEARLYSNSRNSSKPPSSDGYQKKQALYQLPANTTAMFSRNYAIPLPDIISLQGRIPW